MTTLSSDAETSQTAPQQIIPVLIGADLNCYHLARTHLADTPSVWPCIPSWFIFNKCSTLIQMKCFCKRCKILQKHMPQITVLWFWWDVRMIMWILSQDIKILWYKIILFRTTTFPWWMRLPPKRDFIKAVINTVSLTQKRSSSHKNKYHRWKHCSHKHWDFPIRSL